MTSPAGFVCLYYGGTGSSWLLNTLETSPALLIPAYEPLEWMHWQTDAAAKLAWVEALLDVPDSSNPAAVEAWKERLRRSPQFVDFDPKPFRIAGFKMSAEALPDHGGLLDVIGRGGGRLLAIRRRDRVRHALSLYRSHEEDKHQFRDAGLLPPTRLKKRPFLKWLAYSRRVDDDLLAIVEAARRDLGEAAVMVVDYESFVDDAGKVATVQAVAEWLEIDPASMTWSRYRKATPDSLEDAVENYRSLQRWLQSTQ